MVTISEVLRSSILRTSDRMDEMIAMFCELRKSKNIQPDEARKILSAGNYFGTMLVKMGVADALLGGADILNSRYSSSSPSADQDKTRQQDRIFMLHHGSSICYR